MISVRRVAGALVLRGFPGTSALRVRRVGQSVQAWDSRDRRWEPFLRLGAPRGTRYRVDLAGTALWRRMVVTVEAKRAVIQDSWDRTGGTARRLAFESRLPIADLAGLESVAFAPGVGPVWFEELTIAEARASSLSGYRVSNRRRRPARARTRRSRRARGSSAEEPGSRPRRASRHDMNGYSRVDPRTS